MLDQLVKTFERLLLSYGIWVALFMALMVVIPVSFLILRQRRVERLSNDQLSEHYQTLAGLQQQLNGMETVLTQYHQRAAGFTEETRSASAELLQLEEDCLARVLRLKSEIRETEARLPQLGDQLLGSIEDAETEVTAVKKDFEQIEVWHKRLNQAVADSRTQLHQLQADLDALTEPAPDLRRRLQALQAEATPSDPVAYQQALQQLQQDIQARRSLPPLPSMTGELSPVQILEAQAESSVEAVKQSDSEISESPALVQTPLPLAEEPVLEVKSETEPVPASVVAETFLGQRENDALEAALSELLPEQAETEPISEQPAEDLDSVEVEAITEKMEQALSEDLVTETFLGQRGEEQSVDSSTAELIEGDASEVTEQVSEEAVLEIVAEIQSESQSESTEEVTAAENVESTAEAEDESVVEIQDEKVSEPAEPEADVLEQDAELDQEPDQAVVIEDDDAFTSKPESPHFVDAGERLTELADELLQVEVYYQDLESGFVPEAWSESLPLLERSRYLADEAHELLILARRLEEVPQAPAHRVQLNLLRLNQKCEEIQNSRAQLARDLAQLGSESERLKTRLVNATGQLQELRSRVEQTWLQEQAGRLKEVRRSFEQRPFHLPACRQQLRQIEIEIETQAQA